MAQSTRIPHRLLMDVTHVISSFKISGEHARFMYSEWNNPIWASTKALYISFAMLWCNGKLPLHWRYNDHGGVSNHQPHGCILNRLFRCRSKKTSKLRVTDLCARNSPGPVKSPHKGPVTRKMFPFGDVIMINRRDQPLLVQFVTEYARDMHVNLGWLHK